MCCPRPVLRFNSQCCYLGEGLKHRSPHSTGSTVSRMFFAFTHAEAVKPMAGAEVEGFAVGVAEGEVVGVFGANESAEVLAAGGDNPEAAGAGDTNVAGAIDFQAVES